jgi:hypothetical protein
MFTLEVVSARADGHEPSALLLWSFHLQLARNQGGQVALAKENASPEPHNWNTLPRDPEE